MHYARHMLRVAPSLQRAVVRHSTTDALDDPKVASNMKKYGMIAAPFVITGVMSSIVCMSETVRDFAEDYVPSYGNIEISGRYFNARRSRISKKIYWLFW